MSDEDRSYALVALAVLMILLNISRVGRLLYRAVHYCQRRPTA